MKTTFFDIIIYFLIFSIGICLILVIIFNHIEEMESIKHNDEIKCFEYYKDNNYILNGCEIYKDKFMEVKNEN